MAQRKIGLLGGSFNPIHQAHIRLALIAFEQLQLDEVQLIPAGHPWQKKPLSVSNQDRLTMIQLAIRDYPVLQINTIELERTGPSYTIDTVIQLSRQNGEQYYWIMGSDQINNFCTWRQWQEIIDYVQLVVATRPQHIINPPEELRIALQQKGQQLLFINMKEMDLSSTQIRQSILEGKHPLQDLHPDVLHYIQQHHLYLD